MTMKAAMRTSVKLILGLILSAWTIQPLHAQVSTGAGLGPQTVATWNSLTPVNTTISIPVNITPTAVVAFNLSGTLLDGAISFETTTAADGKSNMQPAVCYRLGITPKVELSYSLTGLNQMWQCPVAGATAFAVRLSTPIRGTGTANITLNGTSGFPSVITCLVQKSSQ